MAHTHFGFKTVEDAEKTSLVRGVFNAVASKYDLMNDAMSLGVHRLWKREFISRIRCTPSMRCLDVAGGTGDIGFSLLQKGVGHVTLCDINQEMLNAGKARALDKNIREPFDWLCANAESLPLPSNNYHLYTISFGIRNVTHIDAALKEAHRVLAPGGRFMCLEFSYVKNDTLRAMYDRYSFGLIPKLGKWLAKDEAAYQYLVESIRKFPKPAEFSAMIAQAGFAQVTSHTLSGGVVAIHSGYKL